MAHPVQRLQARGTRLVMDGRPRLGVRCGLIILVVDLSSHRAGDILSNRIVGSSRDVRGRGLAGSGTSMLMARCRTVYKSEAGFVVGGFVDIGNGFR